ncbi:MAG: outer membrane protein transport protein [Blastocatellia bacterium]|nr:outer membrane protein transport protein [Blastocatellia bacterium]
MRVTHYALKQGMRPWLSLVAMSFALMVATVFFGGQSYAQGINYPVGNPTGTSGAGNARTDPDNFFMRNNVAGMTEIPVNDTEENTDQLQDSGKGGLRLFGELQGSFYKYKRERTYAGPPLQGTVSETNLIVPGAAGEVTYTSGDHKYAVGVGVYTLFGFQSKIADPKTLGPRALFFDSRAVSNDIAFGGAVRLNKFVSVGASFILGRGFLDIKAPVADLLVRGINADSRLDVSKFGAPGYSVGIHFRPTDKHAIAFNFKGERSYNMEGTLAAFAAVPVAGGIRLVPIKPDVKVNFKLPNVAEFGYQYRPTQKLSMFADYRYYGYADVFRTFDVIAKANGAKLTGITINGKNVHSVRFGTVYEWSEKTKLNAGFAFTSNGFRDQFTNPGLVNTGGVDISGAIHKKLLGQWFNVGLAGVFGRDRNVIPTANPAFSGVYSGRGLLVGLGVRFRH